MKEYKPGRGTWHFDVLRVIILSMYIVMAFAISQDIGATMQLQSIAMLAIGIYLSYELLRSVITLLTRVSRIEKTDDGMLLFATPVREFSVNISDILEIDTVKDSANALMNRQRRPFDSWLMKNKGVGKATGIRITHRDGNITIPGWRPSYDILALQADIITANPAVIFRDEVLHDIVMREARGSEDESAFADFF